MEVLTIHFQSRHPLKTVKGSSSKTRIHMFDKRKIGEV